MADKTGCNETVENVPSVLSNCVEKVFNDIAENVKKHTSLNIHSSEMSLWRKKSSMHTKFLKIKNYHVVCLCCKDHLFTHSRIDDISSFFQRHINTEYHKLSSYVKPWSKKRTMFTWEEFGVSARCNLCEISGLNATVFDIIGDVNVILSKHICNLNMIMEPQQYEILKKICNVNLFREKLITSIDDNAICLLCKKIICNKSKICSINYHLLSKQHCNNFVIFIKQWLGYDLEDWLNGFILEEKVVKSFLLNHLEFSTKDLEKDICQKELCKIESNWFTPLYKSINCAEYLEIVPNLIRKNKNNILVDINLTNNKKCDTSDEIHSEEQFSTINQINTDSKDNLNKDIKNIKNSLFYDIYMKMISKFLTASFISDEKNQSSEELEKKNLVNTSDSHQDNLLGKMNDLVMNSRVILSFICSHSNKKKNKKKNKIDPLSVSGKSQKKTSAVQNKLSNTISEKDLNNKKPCQVQKVNTTEYTSEGKNINRGENLNVPKLGEGETIPESKNNTKKKRKNEKTKEKVKDEETKEKVKDNEKEKNQEAKEEVKDNEKEKNQETKEKVKDNEKEKNQEAKEEVKDNEKEKNQEAKEKVKDNEKEKNQETKKKVDNLKLRHQKYFFYNRRKGTKNMVTKDKTSDGVVEKEKNQETKEKVDNLKLRHQKYFFYKRRKGTKNMVTKDKTSDGVVEKEKNEETKEKVKDDEKEKNEETKEKVKYDEKEKNQETKEKVKDDEKEKNEETKEKVKYDEKEKNQEAKEEVKDNEKEKNEETKEKVKDDEKEKNQETKEKVKDDEKAMSGNQKSTIVDLQLERPKTETLTNKASESNKGLNVSSNIAGNKSEAEVTKSNEKNDKNVNQNIILTLTNLPLNTNAQELSKFLGSLGDIKDLIIQNQRALLIVSDLEIAKRFKKMQILYYGNLLKMSEFKNNEKQKNFVSKKNKKGYLDETFTFYLMNPNKMMKFIHEHMLEFKNKERFELEKNRFLCEKIETALRNLYPNAKCQPFGSRFTGAVTDQSDLDVYVDLGVKFNEYSKPYIKLPYQLSSILNSSKLGFQDFKCVPFANVPLLSFYDKDTKLKCDLSYKWPLSVVNSVLIKFLFNLDERLKKLVLILKGWSQNNNLHGRPMFSSYALTMMLIFYLQQLSPPLLPPIELLQKNYQGKRFTISGWDASFSSHPSVLPEYPDTETVPNLLLGFFKFCAKFPYKEYLMSPSTGQPVLREAFIKDVFKLPMAIKRHYHLMPIDKFKTYNSSCIIVLDPFDLSHNLTSAFPKKQFNRFLTLCEKSVELLQKGIASSSA